MQSRYIMLAAIAIAAACSLGQAADAPAGSGNWNIYYQATYEDGSIRDLSEPPAAKQGIRMLLRIARCEGDEKGYEKLSTGSISYLRVRRGETVRHELHWDGQAWTGPELTPPQSLIVAPQDVMSTSAAPGESPTPRSPTIGAPEDVGGGTLSAQVVQPPPLSDEMLRRFCSGTEERVYVSGLAGGLPTDPYPYNDWYGMSADVQVTNPYGLIQSPGGADVIVE